jgi:hypothetical protein
MSNPLKHIYELLEAMHVEELQKIIDRGISDDAANDRDKEILAACAEIGWTEDDFLKVVSGIIKRRQGAGG